MSPRPDVSEERTEQIIKAALEVFSERGFEKARMEDVGRRAGISKATVYLYFKSKEVLIGAIMKRLFSRELSALETLEDSDNSARQRLSRFVTAIVDDLRRMRPLMPLLYEFYALGLRKEPARRILGDSVVNFVEMMTPVIQDGVDQGEFCAVDARKTAIALGAAMEGTLLMWSFAPEHVDLEAQLQHSFDLILAGLCQK